MNFEPERQDVSVFLERWEDMEIEAKEKKAEKGSQKGSAAECAAAERAASAAESEEELEESLGASTMSMSGEEEEDQRVPCGGLTPLLMAIATGAPNLRRNMKRSLEAVRIWPMTCVRSVLWSPSTPQKRAKSISAQDLTPKTPSLRALDLVV